MQIELNGKTAVISGSTAGIGFAVARALAGAGAAVTINGRTEASLRAAVISLRREFPGAQVDGVAADVGTADGCRRLARTVTHADILVNNVGVFGPQDFFEIPDSEWERYFNTNVMSGVRLSRAYAAGMAKRGWGRIVFIASASGVRIPADMIHYGMTKTANLSISRGLAKRLAGTGVTVNAVLPGPTLSGGLLSAFTGAATAPGQSAEQAASDFVREHRPSSIIQRAASVEEVASMVLYVCSLQASATTGAALRVDGGIVDTII